jgi:hypothetical protein
MVDHMPDLPWAWLGVLPTRSGYQPESPREFPMTKLTSNIKWVERHYQIQTGYCSSVSYPRHDIVKDVHFARLCFYTNILRFNQFGLKLPSPLHSVLDPLLSIFKLPFCSSHVSRVGSWVCEETLFPEVVVVCLGQLDGLSVLEN